MAHALGHRLPASSSPPGPRPWATAWSTRRSGSWRGSSRSSGQWTDCDGDPLNIFTRDQLLDNVTVYWFTGTGASSGRLYWESAGPAPPLDPAAMAALDRSRHRPHRLLRVPARAPSAVAPPGRAALHQHPLVERAPEGRPLRRVRTAGTVRRRGAVLVPPAAMSASAHESRPVTRSETRSELLAGANGRQKVAKWHVSVTNRYLCRQRTARAAVGSTVSGWRGPASRVATPARPVPQVRRRDPHRAPRTSSSGRGAP